MLTQIIWWFKFKFLHLYCCLIIKTISTMRKDIREFSDSELRDYFLNDEGLYNLLISANSFDELKEVADEIFICTLEQLDELKEQWEEENE